MDSISDFFGEPISIYTREDALRDGVLVDLSQYPVTREHYKYPVACTAAVWQLIEDAVASASDSSISGILHEVLWISHAASKRTSDSERRFSVGFEINECLQVVHMRCVCGPGDKSEPVITIMMENED